MALTAFHTCSIYSSYICNCWDFRIEWKTGATWKVGQSPDVNYIGFLSSEHLHYLWLNTLDNLRGVWIEAPARADTTRFVLAWSSMIRDHWHRDCNIIYDRPCWAVNTCSAPQHPRRGYRRAIQHNVAFVLVKRGVFVHSIYWLAAPRPSVALHDVFERGNCDGH